MTARAVVVGAGAAGLAAAAAVRRHVDEVVVLERDPGAGPRRGVAQADQLHNLLGCAQVHLERVLPGFDAALRAHGADVADVASQTHVWEFGVRMPRRSLGFSLLSASWATVERALRDVLPPDIRVEPGASVCGLVASGDRVTGVRTDDGRTFRSDVVVVATGARTTCSRWLAEQGLPVPPLEEVPVDRWYVTFDLQRPRRHRGDPAFWLAFSAQASGPGLLLSPAGPERWRASASSGGDDRPPRDLAELLAHAARVADGELARALDGAVQLRAPKLFRKPVVRRHRFDLMADPPEGLWPVGDAVASLNPLLGQGMSVAAWQASLLADAFPRDAAAHHRSAALPVQAALDLTTWGDEPVVDEAGRVVEAHEHVDALVRAVAQDAELHDLYVRMWHLLVPARELVRPAVVERARAAAAAPYEKVTP